MARIAHRGILASLDVDATKVRIVDALYSRVSRYETNHYIIMAGPTVLERSAYHRDELPTPLLIYR